MTFGEFFKKIRISEGYSLRAFCKEFDLDAGNISKLERGVLAAPKNESKMKMFASALNIKEGTEEYREFFILAEFSRGEMITKGLNSEEILKKLPVFLRNTEGDPLSEDQLDSLTNVIKDAWSNS